MNKMSEMTSRADLQAFTDRYLDAWTRRDAIAVARHYAADGVVESPMFATLRGREAIEEAQRSFFTAFPDAVNKVDAVLIDPPRVAIFTTFHATHVQELFGLPASNKRVDGHLARLLIVQDGLIAHERRVYDFTGLLVQVGVLRAKPAKP